MPVTSHSPGYEKALSAAKEAAEKGVGVYEMAVAVELEAAIDGRKKAFRRRKKLLEKLEADAPDLFAAALFTFRKACGGCSPQDAADGILTSYLNAGMDVARARACAGIVDFAVFA